ncbi:BT4734/BF3469 family protein [Aeromonas sp. 602658]|uniref:BT4734/BF3469 family protein n=1 Tax=Aeromonas sp. 602658 TaxID=2712043 RepID=UPI003BA1C18D
MKVTLKKTHRGLEPMLIHSLETIINCIRAGGLGLDTRIESIRQLKAEDRKKEADVIKDNLPAMLMGAYEDLHGGFAQDKAMAHNGIMVIDVDGITISTAEELRHLVMNSPLHKYIAFTFISPSGGLKVGVMTDYRIQNNEHYKFMYKKMVKEFIKVGIPADNTDGSTCNFNRLTYLSYDPDATFNPKPSTLSLKRWQAEFDAIAANEQRLMEQRRIASQSGSYNEHRARAYCDKAVDAIIAGLGAGNRHNGAFKICMTAFKCGLTVEDAADYLMLAKSRGQYTESISPRAKAIDAYKSFDGIVDSRFNDLSLDDVRTCAAKSLASILANHGSA